MKKITPKDDIKQLTLNGFFNINRTVFLAGSMGKDWRGELMKLLGDSVFVFVDPTIEDWENEVGEESLDNPKYVRQVTWEQDGLRNSDVVVFHFDETSLAPISLFEFGYISGKDIIVHLDGKYQKDGYIRIVCGKDGIPIANSVKELASMLTIFEHIR
jgi:hypothetical protein